MQKPIALALFLLAGLTCGAAERPPNFIVIFCDDLGYGDLGCFGSKKNRTHHLGSVSSTAPGLLHTQALLIPQEHRIQLLLV